MVHPVFAILMTATALVYPELLRGNTAWASRETQS